MTIAPSVTARARADDADAQLAEVLGERHDVVGRLHRRPLAAAPERRAHVVGGSSAAPALGVAPSPLSVAVDQSSLPSAPARRAASTVVAASTASPSAGVDDVGASPASARRAATAGRPSVAGDGPVDGARLVGEVGGLAQQVGRLAHLLHRLVERAAASRPGSCCPSSSARRRCARPGAARRAASPDRGPPAPAAGSR